MGLTASTALNQIDTLGPQDSLYHYTTAAALVNLVSTNEFWVTHSNFLNDYSEVDYIETVMRDAVCDFVEDASVAEALCERVAGEFARIRAGFHQMYILSFSTHPDSLTLWSEFSGGYGYLLEIGAEDFRENLSLSGGSMRTIAEGRVVYDRARQDRIIREEVLGPWLANTPLACADDLDAVQALLPALAMSIYEYAPFFKGPAFSYEDEYRFVFYCKEAPGDGPMPCSFRSRDENVIPFIKVDMRGAQGEPLALRRVVVGPKNNSDLAVRGTQYLLKSNGYAGVDVDKSAVTLRY